MSVRSAADRRRAARHRLERPRRQLRAPRPDDRRRRRRRRRAGAAAPRRSRPGSSSTTPTLGEPEGGPSSQFLAEQARRHGVWVGGSCPEIPADARPTTGGRPTASCSPGPTAPSTATARSTRSRYAGEEQHFRPGGELVTVEIDGPAGQPVRLLRPALRRRVLAAGRSTPTSTSCRPTGRPSGACTGRRCCRPGPSRTRPTWSASTGSARAAGSAYSGDSRIVDPLGELLATAARTETILLADVSAAHVPTTRDRFRFLPDRR